MNLHEKILYGLLGADMTLLVEMLLLALHEGVV